MLTNNCEFCGMETFTRQHHLIPRCKGGKETATCCQTCEDFIHNTWNNNELRNIYNNVKDILNTEQFQRFLKWRKQQSVETIFKSVRSKYRNKRKYS
jgi:hypothetical protein